MISFQPILQKKQKSTKASLLLHLSIHSTISQERPQEAQSKDQQLERLRYLITLSQAPTNDPTLKSFHKIFTELSIGVDDILYRGNKILLTTSLYDVAISLAHSGSHTGQDAISNAILEHSSGPQAWTQWLNSALKHAMNVKFTQEALSRPPCPVHQHQHTHVNHFHLICMDLYQTPPISLLQGAIFLTSLMLNLLNQQAPKMYFQPLAPYTPTNCGNPKVHKAVNSKEFRDFTTARRIHIKHSYPYHSQGNEAQCFMKALRKAIQIAIDTNRPLQQAIDDVLSDLGSTPHPPTGVAHGNMLFQRG